MEYIRGRTLLDFLKQEKLPCTRAAKMLADIADAVAHPDQHGFVHRDIKPQNILLDADDHPHVADFGLALSSRDRDVSFDVSGTTHYMAPEQVRGENHRIDGRTDIWALGVTLYLMLTGRLPFPGMRNEAFRLILYSDPTPPSEIDRSIPAELERICLRCLCRQMSDRYRTAAELSHDLHDWFVSETGDTGFSSSTRRIPLIEAPVVPRGLRAFDGDDYDFFLQLLPGPRDRDGLPTSIRFWKKRIEEREAHSTFRVGLLYGPSGCGKSSLINAGLLPRLNAAVANVSVEATPQETEARLLKALQRKFRELPECQNTAEALYQLREHPEISQGRKVLIVIDQFEQWLQSWPSRQDEELIDALRHCDGSRVQCVLSVRDDFWLAVTRFMHLLEVSVVDGENALLVDSFDPAHARTVLRKLGVAYDRLPEQVEELTDEQSSFIEQTIDGLSQENRLLPVRLTVLVEMCRDRPWTPDSLDAMGGTDGVGLTFLENNFGPTANASRRHHEPAARNILAALVPHDGQIKGSVRSRTELVDVSGYTNRPRDFDELLRVLDAELRLISPSGSPELEDSFESDESGSVIETVVEDSSTQLEQRYQLTHDFLVPSIRAWLERGKRETRRGRTQLLLEDQAALWSKRQATRFLPSFPEWAAIQLLTRHKDWRDPERRMMRAATARVARS
jgi:serine/threonine protein kinase